MHEEELVSVCPWCGKVNDFATNVHGGKGVTPGALSVCVSCGQMATWNDRLKLEQVSAEELAGLPDVIRAKLAVMREFIRRRILRGN